MSDSQLNKTANIVKARRLDSLARLIQGSAKCAAVAFDAQKLLIASNALHYGTKVTRETKAGADANQNQNLILDVMSYLAKIASKEQEVTQEQTINILTKIATLYISGIIQNKNINDQITKLVQYSADNNWLDLADLSSKQLAHIVGINKIKQSHGDLLAHAPIAITRLQKDLNKITQDIKKLKQAEESKTISQLDQALLTAFRASNNHLDIRKKHGPNQDGTAYEQTIRNNQLVELNNSSSYGYELLHIDGANGKSMHAEMQITQRLIDQHKLQSESSQLSANIQLLTNQSKNIYIGISMLCCTHCHAAIEAINKITMDQLVIDKKIEHINKQLFNDIDQIYHQFVDHESIIGQMEASIIIMANQFKQMITDLLTNKYQPLNKSINEINLILTQQSISKENLNKCQKIIKEAQRKFIEQIDMNNQLALINQQDRAQAAIIIHNQHESSLIKATNYLTIATRGSHDRVFDWVMPYFISSCDYNKFIYKILFENFNQPAESMYISDSDSEDELMNKQTDNSCSRKILSQQVDNDDEQSLNNLKILSLNPTQSLAVNQDQLSENKSFVEKLQSKRDQNKYPTNSIL